MADLESALGMPGTGKVSQKQVNYRQAGGQQRCANCLFFQGPDACQLVEGPIVPEGLSDLWQSQQAVEDQLFGPSVPPAPVPSSTGAS